jgi:hypothetical protein
LEQILTAIAHDIAIKMQYMRKLNPHCSEPNSEVDVIVPFLKGLFRHEQYVITDNFGAPCTLATDPLQTNILNEDVIINTNTSRTEEINK